MKARSARPPFNMNWLLSVLIGSCMLAATDGAAQSASDPSMVSQDWSRAWEARDLDATLALYSQDAVFLDADGSRISGKDNLRQFFTTVLARYSARPALHSLKSETSGDLGYDWGEYSEVITPLGHPERAIKTSGAYVVILHKSSGRWLIANQVWTGSAPVPVGR